MNVNDRFTITVQGEKFTFDPATWSEETILAHVKQSVKIQLQRVTAQRQNGTYEEKLALVIERAECLAKGGIVAKGDCK